MLDELEWPSLEARRDQSSLFPFHKIHSIEKDKYLTLAHSLKSTRASHSAQYCRYQTYSDARQELISPRTTPQWNGLSPLVVNSQTTEEFRALLIKSKHSQKIFLVFFLFLFFSSSKFQIRTPWRNDRMRSCQ